MSDQDTSRVFIVDDDDSVRTSLAFLLGAAGFAVTTYASATEFLSEAAGLPGGCILTDMSMPGISGLDLLKQVKVVRPDLPVIIMTGHGDVPIAILAMRAGAVDFVEKPFDHDALIASIRSAMEEKAESVLDSASDYDRRFDSLTPQERAIMAMLVDGSANRQIAHILGIGQRTVEVHRANILGKMQAASLAVLVRMYLGRQRTASHSAATEQF